MITTERLRSADLSLDSKREILTSYFRQHARVLDREKGYILAPWVNLKINTVLQGYAADLVVGCFKEVPIDLVAGIPMCGIPLAVAVAQRLEGENLIVPRKGLVYPANFGQDVVITEISASFTTGEKGVSFVFPSLIRSLAEQGNNRLLLVDDFCAKGDTACAIIPSLQELGIEISYATYVSKRFQGGLERIKNLGVEAFSVVTIEEITPDNGLIVA